MSRQASIHCAAKEALETKQRTWEEEKSAAAETLEQVQNKLTETRAQLADAEVRRELQQSIILFDQGQAGGHGVAGV